MRTLDDIIDSIHEKQKQHDLEVINKRKEYAEFLDRKYSDSSEEAMVGGDLESHTLLSASIVAKNLREKNNGHFFRKYTLSSFNVFSWLFDSAGFGCLIKSLPEYDALRASSQERSFSSHLEQFCWGKSPQGEAFWRDLWVKFVFID